MDAMEDAVAALLERVGECFPDADPAVLYEVVTAAADFHTACDSLTDMGFAFEPVVDVDGVNDNGFLEADVVDAVPVAAGPRDVLHVYSPSDPRFGEITQLLQETVPEVRANPAEAVVSLVEALQLLVLAEPRDVSLLLRFLVDAADEAFVTDVLPWMVDRALVDDIPAARSQRGLPPLHVLREGTDALAELSGDEACTLLVHAFLGIAPSPPAPREAQCGEFADLYRAAQEEHAAAKLEKLRCYAGYFAFMKGQHGRDRRLVVRRAARPVAEFALSEAEAKRGLCSVVCDGERGVEDAPGGIVLAFTRETPAQFLFGRLTHQEDVILLSHPEAYMARLLCADLGPGDVIQVQNAAHVVEFRIVDTRGVCLGHVDPAAAPPLSTVAFADAAQYYSNTKHRQYMPAAIRRELNKATLAFGRYGDARDAVTTSHWGCGAQHGDVELKFAIQWCAASAVGLREVLYLANHDAAFAESAGAFVSAMQDCRADGAPLTAADLLELLLCVCDDREAAARTRRAFGSAMSDEHPPVFELLLRAARTRWSPPPPPPPPVVQPSTQPPAQAKCSAQHSVQPDADGSGWSSSDEAPPSVQPSPQAQHSARAQRSTQPPQAKGSAQHSVQPDADGSGWDSSEEVAPPAAPPASRLYLHPTRLPPFPLQVLATHRVLLRVAVLFHYGAYPGVAAAVTPARAWWRVQHAKLCVPDTAVLASGWQTRSLDALPAAVAPFVEQIDGAEMDVAELFSYFVAER